MADNTGSRVLGTTKQENIEYFSVADQDPGSGAFLTPGSGIQDGKKEGSGSGIRNEHPGSNFLELRNHFLGLKYLNSLMRIQDPGSGDGKNLYPGPGMENQHSGSTSLEYINKDLISVLSHPCARGIANAWHEFRNKLYENDDNL